MLYVSNVFTPEVMAKDIVGRQRPVERRYLSAVQAIEFVATEKTISCFAIGKCCEGYDLSNAVGEVLGRGINCGKPEKIRLIGDDRLLLVEYVGKNSSYPEPENIRWTLITLGECLVQKPSHSHLDDLPQSLGLGGQWDRDGGRD